MTSLICSSINSDIIKLILDYGVSPSDDIERSNCLWTKTPFQLACQNGKEDMVKILLNYILDINIKKSLSRSKELNSNPYFQTPLYLAVANGHLNVVEFLLKNGVDVKKKNFMKRTALHAGVCIGNVELTNIETLGKSNNIDIKLKILESLIKYGCEVNAQDLHGNSPLHLAAKNQCRTSIFVTKQYSFNVFKLLLRAGASVNKRNNCGNTPLHLVVSKMYPEIVDILLSYKPNVNSRNNGGDTPLHRACRNQQDGNALKLLNKGAIPTICNKNNRTPLIEAIDGSSEVVISAIYQSGANMSFQDLHGNTALHYAIENLHETVESKTIISTLLQCGCNPNIQNNKGDTPLHRASAKSSIDFTMIILEFGGNPNIKNKYGNTPFHFVTESFCDEFKIGVLSAFLIRGANPNIENKVGYTPLHKLFISLNEYCLRLILQFGGNPNIENEYGITPLHEAIESGHCCKALAPLLQYGGDPNIPDRRGDTCLHLLCRNKCDDCVWTVLKGGANVNVQNYLGDTPVHILLNYVADSSIIMFALMKHGVKFNIRNNEGKTPFDSCLSEIVIWPFVASMESAKFDLVPELANWNLFTAIDTYRIEVESLKQEKVGGTRLSYYDVLKADILKMLRFLKNQRIVDAMETKKHLKLFPNYGTLLDWLYKHALNRRQLLDDLLKMYPLTMGMLPYVCVEHILSYLNEIQLGKLSISYRMPKVYSRI